MTNFENHLALGDASVTVPMELAERAIELIKKQPDAELLIEMLGLDGAGLADPRCMKHNVKKTYATSGYYCKACKSGRDKAARERKKASREKDK